MVDRAKSHKKQTILLLAALAATCFVFILYMANVVLNHSNSSNDKNINIKNVVVVRPTDPTTTSTTIISSSSSTFAPDEFQTKAAKSFLHQRRVAYATFYNETNDQHWRLRGLGWLYKNFGIILTVTLPNSPVDDQVGEQYVSIWNVGDNNVGDLQDRCHSLIIWVRVSGPEIFAGSAKVVNSNKDGPSLSPPCQWRFAFHVLIPGTYVVDAKVMVWNTRQDVDPQECQTMTITKTNATIDTTTNQQQPTTTTQLLESMLQIPRRQIVTGFKVHAPIITCCEMCTRSPHCLYWSFPYPSNLGNSYKACVLYFDKSLFQEHDHHPLTTTWKKMTRNKVKLAVERLLRNPEFVYGRPRNRTSSNTIVTESYFLGCGWSFWFSLEYPCLSTALDDQVHMMKSSFDVVGVVPATMTKRTVGESPMEKKNRLPFCTLQHEQQASRAFINTSKALGRWVREPWPDTSTCPLPFQMDANFSSMFEIGQHDGANPHCWNRDDFTLNGNRCMETGCQRVVDAAWVSHLRRENRWFGVWQPYECQYRELSDDDLQTCITKRGIMSITTEGASLAVFLNQYLQQRLERIHMAATANVSAISGIHLVLHTFSFPHMIWKQSPNDWVRELDRIVAEHQKLENASKHTTENFWVTSFYFSSEREAFDHQGRSEQFTSVATAFLSRSYPQYSMLSAMDLTAAFAFDTTTQQDGMHVIGPPMKMMITKLFHHMCMS